MANTCDTAYKLYGSKESINSIWNVLTQIVRESPPLQGWDESFPLSYFLLVLDIPYDGAL